MAMIFPTGIKVQGAVTGGVAPQIQGPLIPGGPSIGTFAVIGVLGVGGYFLYRHFKKG